MVSKNDEAAAQLFTGDPDTVVDFVVVQARYALWQDRLQHEQFILA
jgi:hypothetical protein